MINEKLNRFQIRSQPIDPQGAEPANGGEHGAAQVEIGRKGAARTTTRAGDEGGKLGQDVIDPRRCANSEA
jgi:hypothetical protein